MTLKERNVLYYLLTGGSLDSFDITFKPRLLFTGHTNTVTEKTLKVTVFNSSKPQKKDDTYIFIYFSEMAELEILLPRILHIPELRSVNGTL